MIKPDDPRKLAIDLLDRSVCAVQVASVVADKYGIFSWGWNSSGRDGFGEHAEAAAIRRANKRRLEGATIYTAARRAKQISAYPCLNCAMLIERWGINRVFYTTKTSDWIGETWK